MILSEYWSTEHSPNLAWLTYLTAVYDLFPHLYSLAQLLLLLGLFECFLWQARLRARSQQWTIKLSTGIYNFHCPEKME